MVAEILGKTPVLFFWGHPVVHCSTNIKYTISLKFSTLWYCIVQPDTNINGIAIISDILKNIVVSKAKTFELE